MGLGAIVAPMFEMRALEWEPPSPADLDSILLTSANGARLAGPAVAAFLHLPCFTVGEATAAEARTAGFRGIIIGDDDGEAILRALAEAGLKRPLHLSGREHRPLARAGVRIVNRCVYAAEPMLALSEPAIEALGAGALPLLHSPRAASHFADLLDRAGFDRRRISIAAISKAAAEAAGSGWRSIHSAARPTDEALLELAAKLCKTGAGETGKSG